MAMQKQQTLYSSLLKARLAKNLTQTQLGERLGLPQSYISQVEQGRHDIKSSTLIEWARALDLEVMLIPRQQLSAVSYLIRSSSSDSQEVPPAYGALPDEVK